MQKISFFRYLHNSHRFYSVRIVFNRKFFDSQILLSNKYKNMNIKELKKGDKIYSFNQNQVLWYTYLCVHPTGQGNYHILIDSFEEPFRIYHKNLQQILDKNLNSYESAQLALADYLEEKANRLRNNK